MMQKDNRYIAFVCTGNTCRSPMAEGIFNKIAKERGLNIRAESFGMQTVSGLSVSENSIIVCKEFSVDLSGKRSLSVEDAVLDKYEKFYCMSVGHLISLTTIYGIAPQKVLTMNISDPFGCDIQVYRQCREQIYNSVLEILKDYED